MKKYAMILMLVLFAGTQMAKAQLAAVTLKSMEGKEVRTDTLNLMNQGRPIIIDFFATWCKPCNRELDAIAEVYQDWVDETGVKLIAVSIDQAHNQNKVKPLVNQHGWEYEVLLDPNSEFKLAMGIPGAIPYTMIIDGKGNIVYRHNGYIEGAEEELIEKVRELVKQ